MTPAPSDFKESARKDERRAHVDWFTVTSEPVEAKRGESLELPVEELLRRARPLPPHEQMALDDLSEEEGEAFLAALAE